MRKLIAPPESLLTRRLRLRKPCEDDAASIFASYGQDQEVTRYLMWRPHISVEDAEAAVRRFLDGWQRGTNFPWLIFDRETGELAGSIALRKDETGFNLGYLLVRACWGRGLMAEAIEAVVNWAFSDPSVFRIWAVCDCENGSSARVLEKAGFEREGLLRKWSIHPNVSGIPRDCFCYARIRED